jgi:hypothetical protein
VQHSRQIDTKDNTCLLIKSICGQLWIYHIICELDIDNEIVIDIENTTIILVVELCLYSCNLVMCEFITIIIYDRDIYTL